jgi:site-specific recombinase XerD
MNQLAIAHNHEGIIQLVTDSVDSPHTKRAYERSLTDFLAWHDAEGRPTLNKAIVQRYAQVLADGGMTPSTINQRLSAIRKLAREAGDNGFMPEQLANGIGNVKGVRQEGTRIGNWLEKAQAQDLLNTPSIKTNKGRRDRALFAVMLGCGLRREEVARLDWRHIQQRDGRWAIVDLVGKRNKIRTVPMPAWAKVALDDWGDAIAADDGSQERPTAGNVFVPVNKGDNITGYQMTPQAIYNAVKTYTEIDPHDLRRTYAKLAHKGGAPLEQIQLSLGHASIQTTERYLGVDQDLQDAPCDYLGLSLD